MEEEPDPDRGAWTRRMPSSTTLVGFALATLVPRLPGLWSVASKRGRAVVASQVLFVLLLTLQKKRALVGRITQYIENVPDMVIPAVTLTALGLDLSLGASSKWPRRLLWGVLSFGMVPSFLEAAESGWSALTSGEADIPALLAMQLGLCLKQVRACAVILLMLTGGEAFEAHALHRAGDELHSLLEHSPGLAHISVNGTAFGATEDKPAEKTQTGDVLLVKQSEAVPVDGTVLAAASASPRASSKTDEDSQALVDESLLTGEHVAVCKRNGETVLAGSRNKGNPFWMKAEGSYSDSVMSLMKAKLQQALDSKASIELKSKKFAAAFTPMTMALAALSCLVSDLSGKSVLHTWESVLAVFMSATPCPASVGVPIAMLGGISAASRFGGRVKSGAAIEAMAKASVVVLDKTGTVTEGQPHVTSFSILEQKGQSIKHHEVLRLLASAEQFATHPLGEAVVAYCTNELPHDFEFDKVNRISNEDGRGVYAEVAGDYTVWIGTGEFCQVESEEAKDAVSAPFSSLQTQTNGAELHAYFHIMQGTRTVLKGSFSFQDEIRPSAQAFVDSLKQLGIQVTMLSGDRSGHLPQVAKQLGIAQFKACWPHEKAIHVSDLRDQGHVVVMVGDGGNDAAALATADAGVSIGATNLASESASVVLMKNDLTSISKLIEMSRRVVKVAENTVGYGMSFSMAQMTFAALGILPPFASAVGQEMIDLGAVLYSLRALQG